MTTFHFPRRGITKSGAPRRTRTARCRSKRDAHAGVIERVEMHVAGRTVPGYAISGSPVMAVTHAVLELAERPIRFRFSQQA